MPMFKEKVLFANYSKTANLAENNVTFLKICISHKDAESSAARNVP